ncbi:GNAT family N-acetyltransferase [Sulfurirhabdus autotrophica]|uniref:Acetyltransferase (GNAT) family protein n=1 Tax=Sulfurirhabdus autotrophica TaxID=1706046 RepID=A0A4R3Y2I1_9PROT|nr:GNAT family N-acetyltransferase [Sulfurirhabdus autotrophica]TCV85900.1 acetyltransferase (GNAT) family protein [Sulfurirhabdus autotrophica]
MFEIVRADLNNHIHAEALIHLMREYALDPMGGGKDLSAFAIDNLASFLNNRNDAHVIFAFHNNEAIGLVTCMEGFSTFACKPLLNIHDAIVKTAYRGQRVLKTLLLEAEKIAIEKGCCKMTLEVLEGNIPARSAYVKFGFHGYELDPKMGKAQFWEKRL